VARTWFWNGLRLISTEAAIRLEIVILVERFAEGAATGIAAAMRAVQRIGPVRGAIKPKALRSHKIRTIITTTFKIRFTVGSMGM
jgi:hypothetical protein